MSLSDWRESADYPHHEVICDNFILKLQKLSWMCFD